LDPSFSLYTRTTNTLFHKHSVQKTKTQKTFETFNLINNMNPIEALGGRMADATLQKDIEDIIKQAQAQPGITELMKAYGRYDEVMEQSRAYVEGRASQAKTLLSTHSA
jgi:hypothetical protein